MKVYLASSFDYIEKVKVISELLEREGHEITVKWWSRVYRIPGERGQKTTDLKVMYEDLDDHDFYERPETKLSFEDDVLGVKDADVFIFVAGSVPRKYNGANVELGIAISEGKKCFSLGALEKSVLYYPVKRCSSVIELLEYLRAIVSVN